MSTEAFRIEGLAGEKTLRGVIPISGSKNEALALLAASVLFDGEVSFSNVPDISDITSLIGLLSTLGVACEQKGDVVTCDGSAISTHILDKDIARKFRASVILTGSLLARLGKVRFPPPGGCLIGKRPIDVFLEGYKKMGADVDITKDEEFFDISAQRGKLLGGEVIFKIQSVTGTEALMMAASLAHGTTTLVNVAIEPEVTHLAGFLMRAGVKMEGIGTSTLVVHGTNGKPLSWNGVPYRVLPDRIEAGSYAVLAALCGLDITITNCDPSHLSVPLEFLKDIGVPLEVGPSSIAIRHNTAKNKDLLACSIKTHEYPGFPTDLQAPFGILCTQATGESIIEEMIFEGRLNYANDLVQMGAVIDIPNPHKAIIKGPARLVGRELYSPDLRAGLAYIIAAIVAKGTSHIHNIHHIDRGYERVEEKLKNIGVAIERVEI